MNLTLNSLLFIITTTLMYSTPLIFASMGGLISERSGIINIGLEGLMTIGAFVASLVAIKTNSSWQGIFCGGMAGLFLASLHALSTVIFKANQVVSGMAINFLGGGIAIFLCRIFFDGTSMTPPIDLNIKIPQILGQYETVYLSFLTVGLIFYFFNFTFLGLRLKGIGENPEASEAAGINNKIYQFFAVLASGFLAGIGGSTLSITIVSNFRPTLISGHGFMAIGAIIFGNWKPIPTLLACLFFSFSQALVIFISGNEEIKIPSQILSLIPYLMTLIVLLFFAKNSKAPKALGEIKN